MDFCPFFIRIFGVIRVFDLGVLVADRALRGMQIGSKSLESEEGVVFADRRGANYMCSNGHSFTIQISVEAEVPATWECRCGALADLVGDGANSEDDKNLKPQRTHWDMLLERRSLEELETLLQEQLEAYRSGELELDTHYRRG